MNSARILSVAMIGLVPLVAQADSKVVLQRSNLRGAPSQTAKLLAVLHAGSVVDAEAGAPTSGYVKVKLSGSGHGTLKQGWILASNLEDSLVVAGMVSD